VDTAGQPSLLLDLEGVDRPTAAGLGELVALHRRLRDLGGTLILCNVSDTTYEALAVARLTELLEVRRAERNGSTAPGASPGPDERRV
jgi:anti-anti-sigma factor